MAKQMYQSGADLEKKCCIERVTGNRALIHLVQSFEVVCGHSVAVNI